MTINTHEGLDALAAQIRHWYWRYVRPVGSALPKYEDPEARHHPLYDGGTDAWGRTRQSIWLELAQWALDSGIDVQSLLRDLAELHRSRKCLTPFEILHYPLDTLEQELTEHRRQVTKAIFYRLQSGVGTAKREIKDLGKLVKEARQEVVRRIGAGHVTDEKTDGNLLRRANMDTADLISHVILAASATSRPFRSYPGWRLHGDADIGCRESTRGRGIALLAGRWRGRRRASGRARQKKTVLAWERSPIWGPPLTWAVRVGGHLPPWLESRATRAEEAVLCMGRVQRMAYGDGG
jgi:hypothetical protein